MWGWITAIIKGIIGPVTDAFTSILNKRQDTTLAGFQAGTATDQAAYLSYLDYQTKVSALAASQSSALGIWFKILYIMAGGSAVLHFGAVMLDSVPLGLPFGLFGLTHVVGSWGVPKLPSPYDTYEGWIIGSLFVHSTADLLSSKASAWLTRK